MASFTKNLLLRFSIAFCLLSAPAPALAATIWSGPTISFSKLAELTALHTLEANQDRITNAVWITRAGTRGIFNIATEELYSPSSPADTEWAWDLNGFNAGLDISTANYENLDFNNWLTAHGAVMGTGPLATLNIPGVLHLISEDIYIDIMFSSWGVGLVGQGGAFAYTRSTPDPIPEPSTAMLLGMGLVGLAAKRRRS